MCFTCFVLLSCCVDEVAAEHIGADCIVHYGRSCLSPSTRLPLMYVFGKRPIDVQECARAFRDLFPDQETHVVILYDVTFTHAMGRFIKSLQIYVFINLFIIFP